MSEHVEQSDAEVAAALAGDVSVPSLQMAEFRSMNVPRLDDYFGAWCIEPIRGLAMMEHVGRMDVTAHVANHKQEPKSYVSLFNQSDAVEDSFEQLAADGSAAGAGGTSIAVIEINGTLMKASSSLGSSSSTVDLRLAIRSAMNDPAVGGILLKIDSPGGSVSGTSDLADQITQAAEKKPVWAFGEDLVASAALWLATQCDEFFANAKTAMIGSIGTVIGLYDQSGRMGQAGVKAKVYATGPLKGAGFPGAEITSAQDTYFQDVVDSTQAHFRQAVMAGRDMTMAEVKSLETGGLFTASEAVRNGLIDGIQSFDKTLSMMFKQIKTSASAKASTQSKGAKPMADLVTKIETQPEQTAEDVTAKTMADRSTVLGELNAFTSRFGAENGAKWFGENVSMSDAMGRHCDVLTERLASQAVDFNTAMDAKDATIADLQLRLSQIQIGDAKGVSFNDGEKPTKEKTALDNTAASGLNRMASMMKLPTGKV